MRVIIILIIVSILGCNDREVTISANITINEVFSKDEIKDIETIFNFFNNTICSEFDENNLDSCYSQFLYKISRQIPDGNIDFNISYEGQQAMYSQLNSISFNNLWEYNMMWKTRDRKDTLRYMTFRHDGSFIEFLEEVGKENEAVKYYHETFVAAGDISPSIGWGTLMNYEHYNVEDIRVKFLIAMHCLTLNDQWNRNEKY